MSKNKAFIGAVVAAVAGFVSATLLAPKSGKETREDIKNAGLKAKGTLTDEAHKAKDTATKKANELKTKAETVADDVTDKAAELKSRTEQAIDGAKKGFSKKPSEKK